MIPFLVPFVLQAATIPQGSARIEVPVRGLTLEVFTYKPPTYNGKRMIMVFHGTLRNADEYRDHAKAMGNRFGALIVAPKFDSARFPSRRYHRGGILDENGKAAPKEDWTYAMIPQIAQEVRRREGRPNMPYTLVGHSAGGQFLVRLAGFFDSGADRIVAANPGSELFPTREMPFGYGFGNLPESLSTDDVLRRYLAQPLVLFLGTADDGYDEDLDESPDAMIQGPGRLQRGRAVYAAAKKLSQDRHWPFHWKLVEATGIGHDHEKMFNHPKAAKALGFYEIRKWGE